jgi:hypothetical protein
VHTGCVCVYVWGCHVHTVQPVCVMYTGVIQHAPCSAAGSKAALWRQHLTVASSSGRPCCLSMFYAVLYPTLAPFDLISRPSIVLPQQVPVQVVLWVRPTQPTMPPLDPAWPRLPAGSPHNTRCGGRMYAPLTTTWLHLRAATKRSRKPTSRCGWPLLGKGGPGCKRQKGSLSMGW